MSESGDESQENPEPPKKEKFPELPSEARDEANEFSGIEVIYPDPVLPTQKNSTEKSSPLNFDHLTDEELFADEAVPLEEWSKFLEGLEPKEADKK